MATKTLTCPYCKGKGTAPSSRLSCMVCGARGTITVAVGSTPCSACKGAGRQRGHILTCFTCRGKGVIEPEQKRAARVVKPKPAPKPRKRHAKVKHKRIGRVAQVRISEIGKLPPLLNPPLGQGRKTNRFPLLTEEGLGVVGARKEKLQETKPVSLWQKIKNTLK